MNGVLRVGYKGVLRIGCNGVLRVGYKGVLNIRRNGVLRVGYKGVLRIRCNGVFRVGYKGVIRIRCNGVLRVGYKGVLTVAYKVVLRVEYKGVLRIQCNGVLRVGCKCGLRIRCKGGGSGQGENVQDTTVGFGERKVAISALLHSELSPVSTYIENKLKTRRHSTPGVWTESTNNIQVEPPALLQIYDYKLSDCVHKESIPVP